MLLSGLGPAPPTYDLPAHSGLGRTEGDNAPRLTLHAYNCKGPERIFKGAVAMKRWKTSSAMYEPRDARSYSAFSGADRDSNCGWSIPAIANTDPALVLIDARMY
jgi:hypothetical protein